jgi:suppressor for copper-sensitivity B
MKKLFIILTYFLSVTIANAQTSTKTEQADLSLITGGYNDNGEIILGLHYKLQPGWHIYWRSAGDNGYPPALDWQDSKNISDQKLFWPAPTRNIDKISNNLSTESYLYKDEVLFPITIIPQNATTPVNIKLHANYAICKDICIPADADLSLDITPNFKDAQTAEIINKHLQYVPKENGHYGINIKDVSSDGKTLQIKITANKSFAQAEIFIEGGKDLAFYNPQISTDSSGLNATFNAPISYLTNKTSLENQDLTITVKNDHDSIEKTINTNEITTTSEATHEENSYSLWLILVFGLLGGLILNVMPCVLPVLSIKLLGVIKHSGSSKSQIASSFTATALGIISSFIALAVLVIALHAAGMNVGWGFHFQEPIFIITLIIILTFFTANLWGFFEIRMPNIGDKAYKKSSENSPIGHFLTGVLATALATPCTAPFLGTAVGFALSRGSFEIMSTFISMGIGMALPYLFFSVFPNLVTKLPRPGAWMVTVKKFMGWLLAATAIWLIWILSHQIGNISAAILSALCIFSLIKLSRTKSLPFPFLVLIIVLSFALPITLSDNSDKAKTVTNDIWQPFNEKDIPTLVASGKTVFVDVTADWCLTCKVNKLLVISDSEVHKALSNSVVIAMQADWTNKDEHIATYMRGYKRVGIPFNIVYGPGAPEGIILSELLNKQIVLDALKKAK